MTGLQPTGRSGTDRDGTDCDGVIADRLRLLAELGGGLVHELANHLSVVLGVTEELDASLPAPARARLRQASVHAAEALAVLRGATAMLGRDARSIATVEFAAVVRETTHMLQKHLERKGQRVGLVVVDGVVGARVRIDRADLMHVVATIVLFVLRATGGAPLQLAVERADRRGSSEPARDRLILRFAPAATDLPESVRRVLLAARSPRSAGPSLWAAVDGERELLRALLLVRRHGGDLVEAVRADGAGELLLQLPAVPE